MLNKKTLILAISMVIIASGTIATYVYHWEHRKPLFEVYFFSLNKGRSIFLRTPKNKTFLIGGGQNSEVIRELTKVMPFYKRKIDYLVIPSAIPAQIGGLIEIIDRYEVGEIILPKIIATSTLLSQLSKEINNKKIHTKEIERGDEIEIEKDFKLNTLFPYEGFKFNKTSLPELGFSFSHGSTSVYLFGGLSKTIQKDIVKWLDKEKVKDDQNLVEFYNNGGENKVSIDLIKKINPKFIFTTKEKTARFVSMGAEWIRKK